MKPRLFSHSTFLFRLVCLLLCYALAAPFSVLMPRTNAVNASTAVASVEPVKAKSIPRKATQTTQSARWRDGELLVRFRRNASATDVDALLLAQGAQRGGRLRGQSGIERLSLSPGFDLAAVASALRANRLVDFAEPNYLITADEITPNDPRFPEQWALKNTGTTGGQFGSDINASQAWGVTTGTRRTVIAIIDSGIDFSHPDLRNNEWNNILEQGNNQDDDSNGFADDLHGWDFVANTAEIKDEQGHGTAVAGVIAARGNNITGISGVMWRASLLSLRVLDQTGTGDIAGAVEAIDYAVQNGAQVINCSWGTGDASVALREAIERASQRGVVIVASAGNGGRDIETQSHYPASFDLNNLISVASTDSSDLPTPFSNWGAIHVAVAAPGKDILTTKMGGDYQMISGSSVSAPFVAGVVGLIKTLRPWLNADRTREMILQGARRVPALTGKVASGGVINAAGALNALGTLSPIEGRNGGNGNNGGENGSNGNGRSSQSVNRPGGGNGNNRARNRDGREFTVTPLAPTRGAPGTGLPNLDDLRRKQPTNPKAADPIPSTRCSHKDPDCRSEKRRTASAAPIETSAPVDLLAWSSVIPGLDAFVSSAGAPISDSPFSLFGGISKKQEWANSSVNSMSLSVPHASLLMLGPTPPPPGSYSAVNDFSATQNSGTWKYGSKTISGSTFTAYPSNANLFGGGLDSWSPGYCCPMVTRNATGTTYTYPGAPSVVQPTDMLNLHPGPSGEKSVVRWTAPSAGTYFITGRFQGIDTGGTTTDVTILHNSTSVFTGNINGHGNQSQFSITRTVVAGDTIDFQAGYGSNNSYGNDSTGLAATITQGLSVESVVWTNVLGVTASGNNLSRPAGSGWNSGASSTRQIISGDGYVEFTATETTTHRMFGLSNGDSNQSYVDIDFAIFLIPGGVLQVYEGGTYRGQFGNYSGGDRFRVSVESGVIKYWKNGTLFYTSTVAPSYPLLVDTSLHDAGATVTNATIAGSFQSSPPLQNVFWTNIVGVTASGSSLTKTASTAWGNAGAVSTQTIASGDGYMEFTVGETNTYRMCGLSYGDSHQSYEDIDFAIYPGADSYVYVYEGGTYRGQFGIYSVGDRLRVAVENGVVKYRRNGTLLYTSTGSPTYPLLVDTSFYSAGATITNAVIATSGTTNAFSAERVDPTNRTGTGGVDLLSGNANWSLPILGLKGRAGLDLGLALSYNSLVWMKSQNGASIKFDADQGTPSPGFRLGFPVIQPRYYNSQVGENAYLLITPSGAHVELRQTGIPNVYESRDSSYLQLTDNGGTLTLKPTDGSQLTYTFYNGQYQCTGIKDRNGNFITVDYYSDGRLRTVTDTLARVITFNYDAYLNLQSITQLWGGVTHQWATFGWGNQTINTSFSGLSIVGPQNNTPIPVLTSVGLDNGTYYKFRYNSWGQVDKVTAYAADSLVNGQMLDTHPLNYTSYIFGPGPSDCPRVTESRVWAETWTGEHTIPSEVPTSYAPEGNGVYRMTMPDGTVYKETYGTGWKKGLVTQTEVLSGGVQKKRTETTWTQDNTALGYENNPRVTETNIYDPDGNQKRTTFDYSQPGYAQYGLPYVVREYAANATTILRETYTDYNLNSQYTDRRIIGLVSAVHVSDGTLLSKTGYEYDATGVQLVPTASNATQHDASYNTSLSAGRGNLTRVSRYDVTDPNNEIKKTESRIGYDINGSVVFSRDNSGHQTNISYADSFSDNINHNTYAYPTVVTDPDGYSSTAQYYYELGATKRTQSPTPAGQTQGAIKTYEYDAAGRISKVNNVNNGAYRRWVYDLAGYVSIFDTVQSGSPEAYSIVVYDGLGRVRATGGDNPNSTGGYRGQFTLYDVMGRAWHSSNPAEIGGNWATAGDDAAAGWVWTRQYYDWKGRPTVTTNPDGTTKLVTYGGCGCAGGEVVTVRDEIGRQQRVTSDILGRAWKTEVLDWSPSQTVYSTTINTYNGRDQIINSRQYQATEASGIFQEAILTYDGHGRLATQKTPIQTSPTSYTYNADDTTNVVTDARGATATFSYNNRHQVTGITYYSPSGVVATAPVSFSYDAVGNRTGMTDGMGSTSYNYDQLSRLTSETRSFTGVGSFTLSYSYNLSGELTSVTDHFGAAVGYTYDKTGRLTDVTGSGYANVTSYASNLRYRAWGGMKSMSYGNGLSVAASYNTRLQLASFEVAGRPASYGTSTVMSSQYQYHADGSLRSAHDLLDERMDRAFSYDHVGRLQEAYTGSEARDYLNSTSSGMQTGPYRQTYQYSVWGELTQRSNRFWSQPSNFTASYVNGRNQNASWQYDNDGRVRQDETLSYTHDAAGRNRQVSSLVNTRITTQEQDGDGQAVRHTAGYQGLQPYEDSYYLRSSVLGGRVIAELTSQGQKIKGYVYAGGEVIARQEQNQVTWQHANPLTGSRGESYSWGAYVGTMEGDPMGVNVGVEDPFIEPLPVGFEPSPDTPMIGGLGEGGGGCSSYNPNCTRCFLDGFAIGCEQAALMMDVGAAGYESWTTVRITYTNGQTQTFTGRTTLPPGIDLRFTGQTAQAANFAFGAGMIWGGFDTGVRWAIGSGFAAQANPVDGRAGSVVGGFASFFLPQQTPPNSGAQQSHGSPNNEQQPQKTPCDVQIPVGNLDQEALVYTLAHEVSGERTQDGFEREARGIASAIKNKAYEQYNRKGELEYGDVYNMVMVRGYISDPNYHPTWTPQDFYRYGQEIVNNVLAGRDPDHDPTRACERLRGIVNAATTPGEAFPGYKYWQGVQGTSWNRASPGRIRIGNTVLKTHWR